jgi:SpoVK/Ycf46/Vps4 family AAA+-type ATPase
MNESNSPKKKKNNPYHNFLNALDSYNTRLSFYKGHRLQNMIQSQYQNHYSMYRKDYEQSQMFYSQHGMHVPDDAYVLWQLEHEADIKPNVFERIRVNKAREKIIIDTNIQNIDDLLSIIENNKIDPLKDYNIDLKALHVIKDELSQLNSMIGLTSLKKSILRQLMYFIQGFANDPKDGDYKHTILTGPPGTGKTEIAKIMGNMYSKVGVLKKNVFKKVTRTDLVAGYLGQTAIKTRKVIDECMGGVLFIDEAYM